MSVLGMSRTIMRNLFTGPATRRYPTRVKEPHRTERSRGRIEIDIEACIFCGACAKRCPTDALIVLKADKEWNIDRLRCCTCNACVEVCIFCSACAKRCPTDAIIVLKSDKEWNIDRLRCCTCNACVEVCPKKCLSMGNRYTPPTVTRDKDIFRQPPKLTKEPETLPGA